MCGRRMFNWEEIKEEVIDTWSSWNDKHLEIRNLTEFNRRIVEDFAEMFYRRKEVRRAFMKYVIEDYIQHNPNIPDGRDAAIEALEQKFSEPQASFDIKRILVDDDLAAIHLHGQLSADNLGGAVVDLFRIENGKIVEHWDVLQAIPTKAANNHPMF